MTAVTVPSSRQEFAALAGLFGIGCAMLVFAAAAPWIVRTQGYQVFIPALAASGFFTIAAARLSVTVPARLGLLIVLGFALAMRLVLVGEEPFLSTDLYRYIWDGRVQAAGINPYVYVPADPALAALRDAAIYPNINRADYAVTAYPPLAEMFFFLVTRIGETLTVMRLAMAGCEIVIVAVLIDLLRRRDLPVTAVVAYAWHPLALWEIANNGHVEALMVALMMLGVWLLLRARPVAGVVAIALAALAKPYAVFALPPFWKRLGLARAARRHRGDCPLLSALSRRRPGCVRLPDRLCRRGRDRQRRGHLAHAADPDADRQNSRPHRGLCACCRHHHDLARTCAPARATIPRRARPSRTSSCC